ncbi:MAG: sigma-70 family RNA polymerase sigma factor [Planctomycetota bacterium]
MIHDTRSDALRPPIDPNLLLAQSSWVEALARTLVRDPFGAEDVFQETMLAALESPPTDAGDARRLRAWLGRVVFNLAHLSVRRSYRRLAREESAAREEAGASTADLVARAAVLDQVAASVSALEEPYRSTVLKRYFEGKSTAQIARETNSTDNAVRKRLWRARAKLRGSLDHMHNGDRLAWFAALAPLGRIGVPPAASAPAAPAAPASLGVTLKSLAASPLLLAGAVVGAALLATSLPDSTRVASAGPELDLAPPRPAIADLVPGAPPGGRRPIQELIPPSVPPPPPGEETAVEQGPGGPVEPPGAAAAAFAVHGRVIDLAGAPVPDLAISTAADPAAVLAWSGADGTFTAAMSAFGTALRAAGPGWATLRESVVERENVAAEHLLVAARTVAVAGTVVDEAGAPLAAARVEVVAEPAAYLSIDRPLNLGAAVPAAETCDAAGRFALPAAVTGAGVELLAAAPGFRTGRWPMPAAAAPDLRLALRRDAVPPTMLAGIVRHADGRPAAGARVWLGSDETIADRHGRFALEIHDRPAGVALRAEKPGYLPGRLEGIGTWIAGGEAVGCWDGLELALGARALSLAGHLYDEAGAPLAGWLVSTVPAEEPAASGAAELAAVGPDGSFVLEGLAEGSRHYVQAFDPESLLALRAGPFAAGATALSLHLDPDAWRPDGEGRVVDEAGRPLAGAEVALSLLVQAGEEEWRQLGPSTFTDAGGHFAFAQVPRQWVEYRISHSSVQTQFSSAAEDGEDEGGGGDDYTSFSRCTFRLETLAGALGPDSFAVLDDAGEELSIVALGYEAFLGRILDGQTLVHEVGANARTLVLFRAGAEAGRTEIALVPGEVVLLRPGVDGPWNGEDGGETAETAGGARR